MTAILSLTQAQNAIGGIALAGLEPTEQAWLTGAIEALPGLLEKYIAPIVLEDREVDGEIGGGQWVALPWPINSVTTATDPYGTTIDPTTYSVVKSKGMVGSVGGWPDGPLKLTVNVGYFVGPPDNPSTPLKAGTQLAAQELIKFMWQQSRQGPGAWPGADSGQFVLPTGFAVPSRVVEMARSDRQWKMPGFA